MPLLGLGTFPMNGLELLKSSIYASKLGYSLIDTSSAYGNEKWLGLSLRISQYLNKEKFFITTKLSNTDQRKGCVRQSLMDSLKRLQLKKVDLYLMHWPNPDTYLDSWKQMEEIYNEGLVRAIGVCNFHQHHLEQLLEIATVLPAVNQIELHPLLSQESLRLYCKNKGICVESYSPIARMHPQLIRNKILVSIANKHRKTVPQIIFRWNIQHGIIVIPKSSKYSRLKQNISVFDFLLTSSEMREIDSLNEDFRIRHNPDTADMSKL